MPVPDDYRRKAAECLRLAQGAEDSGSKALLLEMAQAWVKLAEQTKTRDDLVED